MMLQASFSTYGDHRDHIRLHNKRKFRSIPGDEPEDKLVSHSCYTAQSCSISKAQCHRLENGRILHGQDISQRRCTLVKIRLRWRLRNDACQDKLHIWDPWNLFESLNNLY